MRDACSFEGSKVEFTVCCCLLQELRRGGMGGTGAVEPTYRQRRTHSESELRLTADRLPLNSSHVPHAPLVVVTQLPWLRLLYGLHSPLTA